MKTQKQSKTAVIIPLLLGIAIVFLATVIGVKLYNRHVTEREQLGQRIRTEKDLCEKNRDFLNFVKEATKERERQVALRDNDLARLITEEYSAVQLSMWDDSMLSGEWYTYYFGLPIVYADYDFSTPSELCEYIRAAGDSENNIQVIYICIDPYKLKQNYYDEVYYDMAILTYEEYIYNYLIELINEYPNILFKFILPDYSLMYWDEIGDDNLEMTMDEWYTFLMYLHWCPNAVVTYMGSEEWLVANRFNYSENCAVKDDLSLDLYLYSYVKPEYEVNGPEFQNKRIKVEEYLENYRAGLYGTGALSDKKIVFFGDSTIAYPGKVSASIPGCVSGLTGCDCYNLSIGGTLASGTEGMTFNTISDAFLAGKVLDGDCEPYRSEAGRYIENYASNSDVSFIIQYGFNDYFGAKSPDDENDRFNTSTFGGAMRSSISKIQSVYSDSRIIVMVPYKLGVNEGGKISYFEGGAPLEEYCDVVRSICDEYDLIMYDADELSGITFENAGEYLSDGTHPTYMTDFMIAKEYAELLK